MTPTSFARRFLYHVTAAADVLAVVLLTGEFLAPGSVLPFIDAIDLLLPLIALNVVTAFVAPRMVNPTRT